MTNQSSFCHVFLSFKGETRNKFTCFLYEALKAEGFVAFMDKSDIGVGDHVHSKIQDGIKSSMGSIIVFSQNYAYSPWCLDELVLILNRQKTSRYFIVPIYYEVEHKDIKHQLGNYALALEKHRARYSDKIDKWRQALSEVGDILGDQIEGLQSIFIQNTVKLIREKLATNFPEYRLPTPKKSDNPSSSCQRTDDKVILYTTRINNVPGANESVKEVLKSGDVVYEKRNCTKEPKYLKELEELVGKDNVRFPMLIVNGKDLCGEEEVEGLDDFDKQKLIQLLRSLYASEKSIDESDQDKSTERDQDKSTESNQHTVPTPRFRDEHIVWNFLTGGIVSRKGVRITNKLHNTLVAHCHSGDDDFGEQQLIPDQSMEWHFYRNPFGRSLFWCDFQDGSRSKSVTLYDETTQICPTNYPEYNMLCYWEMREDGFYFKSNSAIPWVKKNDW